MAVELKLDVSNADRKRDRYKLTIVGLDNVSGQYVIGERDIIDMYVQSQLALLGLLSGLSEGVRDGFERIGNELNELRQGLAKQPAPDALDARLKEMEAKLAELSTRTAGLVRYK